MSRAEHAEEEVWAAWDARKAKKSHSEKPSRRNAWLVFLNEMEKGKKLRELLLTRCRDLRKQHGSTGDGAIANTLVSMYDRLSKLHHYQVSRTAIDIVEGPLTAQECSVLECIAQLWDVEYKIRLKGGGSRIIED